MLDTQRFGCQRPSAPFHPAISINDDGLVCGAGSILVRMSRAGGGRPRLMVDDDAGRLVAMLSAAFNRRVTAAEIMPPVSAAAAHWSRGDKALANFRLIFARLPSLRGPVDADRLRLAEYALDRGFLPDALMKELGFAAASLDLRRYREDEPRVPAGYGVESGRWAKDPQLMSPQAAPTRVAEIGEDGPPPEGEKDYQTRRLEGATTRQEDIEHGRGGPLRVPELPPGIGPGPFAGEPIPAGPAPTTPKPAQQRQVTAQGYEDGCHICGAMDPGTKDGHYVCDHQDPNCLVTPGTMQYYLPSCLKCSQRQGGLLRAHKLKGGT